MTGAILVLNAGSSSLKFTLYAGSRGSPRRLLRGQIEGLTTAPAFVAHDAQDRVVQRRDWPDRDALGYAGAVGHVLEFVQQEQGQRTIAAVGHRVVHGGEEFGAPVRIDAEVLARLERLVPLAPLHQPHNLAPMRVVAERAPALPQVACFDTSFHRTQDPVARAFGLPPEITERGVRRYGFHGLSYEYIADAFPRFDPAAARGRVIAAHLGNGASMCAMKAGRSIATTMGFTALDGLMMGTRAGSLDPGVVLYLMDELKMDARAIERLLYRQSGLLGVSGVSSDMRTLLSREDPRSGFAIELFCYRVRRELGSLAAALGGVDAIVFTAGIGEHSSIIRRRICEELTWLGLDLDVAANERHASQISRP
ncbi:MAG TPA: acetate/propionate family kinase, partial [Casimicrobiaceae bacterium]|nr:acetate/propionate family kinase [Casimicrobiaceae bacterium]